MGFGLWRKGLGVGGDVGGEGGIHGAGAAGEPGEVAPADGELFGGDFGRLAEDGVGVEREGEAGTIRALFAVDEDGFGGGAHELDEGFHIREARLGVGGEGVGVEINVVLRREGGFARVPVVGRAAAAEVDDAGEGGMFAADFLPLVVREGGGAVDIRRDDGEVAFLDKPIVQQPADEEDGNSEEDEFFQFNF